MRLILARHGQSFGNVDPLAHSGTDSALTPLGERQAERLGVWLKQHHSDIDLILASPLLRALTTAQIVNRHLNVPMEVDPDLTEIQAWDLPMLERRPFPTDKTVAQPSAPYYNEFLVQAQRMYNKLLGHLGRPQPLLVVAHGGLNGTLLRLMLERHDLYFTTNNTGLAFLQWETGNWKISGMNSLVHLTPDMVS